MAMDIIPKALYPLVPKLPGVPPLLRNAARIADTATLGFLGLSDALSSLIGSHPPQWGVFTSDGKPVAIADSVLSFECQNGSRLSDYPVEKGAFASYNKVGDPYDVRVRLVRGGTTDERADFLIALTVAAVSLKRYSVVTPELTYDNANVVSLSYRRESSNGAGVIIAELHLREVRETVKASGSSPKSPAAASPQSMGQVQALPIPYPVVAVKGFR